MLQGAEAGHCVVDQRPLSHGFTAGLLQGLVDAGEVGLEVVCVDAATLGLPADVVDDVEDRDGSGADATLRSEFEELFEGAAVGAHGRGFEAVLEERERELPKPP